MTPDEQLPWTADTDWNREVGVYRTAVRVDKDVDAEWFHDPGEPEMEVAYPELRSARLVPIQTQTGEADYAYARAEVEAGHVEIEVREDNVGIMPRAITPLPPRIKITERPAMGGRRPMRPLRGCPR